MYTVQIEEGSNSYKPDAAGTLADSPWDVRQRVPSQSQAADTAPSQSQTADTSSSSSCDNNVTVVQVMKETSQVK